MKYSIHAASLVVGTAALVATLIVNTTAQQPATNPEVFVGSVKVGADVKIDGPFTNLSNSPGYDSQPGFLPDGSAVLFSSQREGTQYDIYKYDFAAKKVMQVTHTEENENSP